MVERPASEIWEAALGELQIQITKSNYRTWLEKTVGVSFDADKFIIGVPNTFIAEYLDKNQRSLIEKTLIGLTRPDITIQFQVNGKHHLHAGQDGNVNGASLNVTAPRFNAKYTFDSFVVSDCNRLAYAAVRGVIEKCGLSYNPLVIYGGTGLGKTHLLHAAGNLAPVNHIHVLYVSAEQFTTEFINSVQKKKTDEFRGKYRNADLLLIDDIQFICGKEQTEESFFHTFNDLHNANRQIVLTSDRPPKYMPFLTERLRSRLDWGLVADIQPPDYDTRIAILQSKIGKNQTGLTTEVLEFIATQATQNIRELEGYLNRVTAFAKLTGTIPSREVAVQAIKDIASTKTLATDNNLELVLQAVADAYKLPLSAIKGRNRDRETVLARQVAMYLLKEITQCSLTRIGTEIGGRDHSTVLHSYSKIASDITTSPSLKNKISSIQRKVHTLSRGS